MRLDLGERSLGLRDLFLPRAGHQQVIAAPGGGRAFLEGSSAADGAVTIGFGNGFLLAEFLGALRFNASKLQLGNNCFPIALPGGDLLSARPSFHFGQDCGGFISLGLQFGCVQRDYYLAIRQVVAFPCAEDLHAAAVA